MIEFLGYFSFQYFYKLLPVRKSLNILTTKIASLVIIQDAYFAVAGISQFEYVVFYVFPCPGYPLLCIIWSSGIKTIKGNLRLQF